MNHKILIVHNHIRLTGVSTFLLTFMEALHSRGFLVDLYVEDLNRFNVRMLGAFQKYGRVYAEKSIPPDKDYTHIFFNYNNGKENFKHINNASRRYIVHSLHGDIYLPLEDIDYDKVFCMSEVSLEYVKTSSEKILIRNFINLTRYRGWTALPKDLKNILVLDWRGGVWYSNHILRICRELNLYCNILATGDPREEPYFHVQSYIEQADLVIGYGRCIYESMAYSKATLVYGYNGGDGYVLQDNFKTLLKRNCSGWEYRKLPEPTKFNTQLFKEELLKYNYLDGEINREMVQELDVNKYIDILLN